MKKTLSALLFSLTLLLTGTLPARAGLVTPAGLNPGDQFRIIFVSSGERDAESTNIADYDQFITNLAIAAGIDTYFGSAVTWQAVGSTEAVSSVSRLSSSSPALYRLDGVKVADSGTDLWDGDIDAPINVNELGVGGLAERVATGTNPDGSTLDGGFGDPSAAIGTGRSDLTTGDWIFEGFGGSGGDWNFYGYSSVLTVPQPVSTVSEPASLSLLSFGALSLLCYSRRRRGR